MAINLGDVEDIKLVELRQRRQEFLKPFLDSFCARVRDRMMSIPVDCEIERYIETMDIRQKVETVDCHLWDIEAKIGDEDIYFFMDSFLEQVFYLHCAMELEYKKQEELKKQEAEKLQEFDDLKKAQPIFDMLKNEVRKWNWGNDFDEYTISMYIAEMVELGKKHNIDLGIKEDELEVMQEIPTAYATELEVKEDK